jgi:undecaprenyl-diphosphatase
MTWSARLGDGWMWVGAAALAAVAPHPLRALRAAVAAAAAANLCVVALKPRVRRPRPAPRPANCFYGSLGGHLAFDEFSFPSGHALNAFALLAVVAPAVPAAAPLLLALALAVAASRVFLGVHFLGDVAAGAVLGGVIGAGCTALFG